MLLQTSLLICFLIKIFAQNPCQIKTFNSSENIACVCNSTYCDDFPQLPQLNADQAAVYVSSKSGKRFELSNLSFVSDASSDQNVIKIQVDPSQTYQSILGFGGAFTGATTYNIWVLRNTSNQISENLLKSYFGDGGIGYTMGRVPIGSADFSTVEYSYDNVTNDFDLVNFKLGYEDIEYKIPFIQRAINLTQNKLKLYGSPWSAPGWMKADNSMNGGTSLIGNLTNAGNQYYKTWANYFVKFFESYNNSGIKFWGVTIQNEPLNGARYQSMIMTAEQQRDFIKTLFGPVLKNNSLTKDIKIMIWDFNRGSARDYVDTVLADLNTSSYVDGVAMHWYDDFGWFGSAYGSNVLENIHQSHPDKWILNTEGCVYKPSNGETNFIGNWQDGDYYARDIIDNLNHWSTGWVDWNMVLNEDRGPLWNMSLDTGTIVDAPIIIKNDGTEFYKNPAYYIMGHFSKFIVPNSTRVNMNLNQSVDSPVQGVSFLTPSNQIVTVLYNWNNITNYTVSLQTKGSNNWINLQLEKLSITTLIWNQVTTTAAPSTSATNLAGNVWICVFSIITFLLR